MTAKNKRTRSANPHPGPGNKTNPGHNPGPFAWLERHVMAWKTVSSACPAASRPAQPSTPLLYIQRVDLPRFSQRPEMTGYVRKIKKPVPLPPPVILTLPQRSG